MTPNPPSSSDGSSLPPRHRPVLGDLAKDTTEQDLWAFEDDLEIDEPPRAETPRASSREIPAPREQVSKKPRDSQKSSVPKTPTGGEERVRMNISKSRHADRQSGPSLGVSKAESEFDDLEAWEDAKPEPEIEELPVLETVDSKSLHEVEEPAEPSAAETDESPGESTSASGENDLDEFEPVVKENAIPVSLRPHLGLSRIERLGLVGLLLLLVVAGTFMLGYSILRLPTQSERADERDFPIEGEKIKVVSAVCYWRAPVEEGDNADVTRRGTLLLPVIELGLEGGPSTIRVFFKDDEGRTVGDPIIHSASSSGSVKIAATAGFDDPGMYAAYRTGGADPWSVEVFEIPSGDIESGNARKLFEMNIPADRR